MNRETCKAITKAGSSCQKYAIFNGFCKQHNRCKATTSNGKKCSRQSVNGTYCIQHQKIVGDINNNTFGSTITITFGDQAENHVGMGKIGNLLSTGLSTEQLHQIYVNLLELGFLCELINLKSGLNGTTIYSQAPDANILVIRNWVSSVLYKNGEYSVDDLYNEHRNLNWDTKAKMYGRVVNKKARHNLCYADFNQEPNYEQGQGRVIKFDQVPLLEKIREYLPFYFGEQLKNLVAEGNLYYSSTCGIGFHGDSERKVVVAIRLGDPIPLRYQWFLEGKSIGKPIDIKLGHGDLYIMSDKAVGHDWKKKKILTLRHAAGAKEYLTPKK